MHEYGILFLSFLAQYYRNDILWLLIIDDKTKYFLCSYLSVSSFKTNNFQVAIFLLLGLPMHFSHYAVEHLGILEWIHTGFLSDTS